MLSLLEVYRHLARALTGHRVEYFRCLDRAGGERFVLALEGPTGDRSATTLFSTASM